MIEFLKSLFNWIIINLEKLKQFFKYPKSLSDLYIQKKDKNPDYYYKISNSIVKSSFAIIISFILCQLTIKYLPYEISSDSYVVVKSNFISFILLIFVFSIAFNISYKLFKFFYRIAEWQFIVGIAFVSYLLLLRKNAFDSDRMIIKIFDKIDLVDFILILFFSFFVISIVNRFSLKFNKARNIFYEDNPVDEDTKIEKYEKIIQKLNYSILKDKYEKSFSIGIIAPWGNGKSSLMNQLKQQINEFKKSKKNFGDFITKTPQGNSMGYQEIVSFDFIPFLNHNEENVINDFFTKLSNELKYRSNSVSNKLETYASKLIKTIEEKKASNLLSINAENNANQSISELYLDIEKLLDKLQIKFVIFIDDLDRLNPNEIIQILKLIRNTSNFPNFVFIVALDKDYINKSLKEVSGTSNNFLDKFFQLECFLPEIDPSELIEYSKNLISKSSIFTDNDKNKITTSIFNEVHLYLEYIRNFRDVKKLINQVILDYNNIENLFDEISVKDYFNILFLKLNHPEIYRLICVNYDSILEVSSDKLTLKKNAPNSESKMIEQLLDDINSKTYFKPDLTEYNFGFTIIENEQSTKKYSKYEKELIFRTIYELFNESNNDAYSIRFLKNFYKIVRQQSSKDELTFAEYDVVLKSNIDEIGDEIDKLIRIDKLNQFIDRFTFGGDFDEKKFIICLKILLKTNYNSTNYYKMFYFVAEKLKDIENTKANIKQIIQNHFLNTPEGDVIGKIQLLTNLKNSHDKDTFWGFSRVELVNEQIKILKDFSASNYNKWIPSDDTLFRAIFIIYDLGLDTDKFKEIKEIIIDFIKNNDLNVFVFNILTPNFESHYSFKLNNIVKIIFDNSKGLEKFIKKNFKDGIENIREFMDFLELNIIVDNEVFLKYKFTDKILMDTFEGWGIPSKFDIERSKDAYQAIFWIDAELISRIPKIDYCFSNLYKTENDSFVLISSNVRNYSQKEFIKKVVSSYETVFIENNLQPTRSETGISHEINSSQKIVKISKDGKEVFKLRFLSE